MSIENDIRRTFIRQMVAAGMNQDELEALSDLEVQDRFNLWLRTPHLKRVRLDSADPTPPPCRRTSGVSVQYDYYGQILPGTVHLDATALAAAQASEGAYERSKAAMNASRYAAPALAARGDSRADAPTFRSDAEAEECAYRKSVQALNASQKHSAPAPAGAPEVVARWAR